MMNVERCDTSMIWNGVSSQKRLYATGLGPFRMVCAVVSLSSHDNAVMRIKLNTVVLIVIFNSKFIPTFLTNTWGARKYVLMTLS